MAKKAKVKKISLLIIRRDFESLLQQLMQLECFEIGNPDDFPEDQELTATVTRETPDLSGFNTNAETIVALGTRETLALTGWLSVKHESLLEAKLSEFICAWDINDISEADGDNAPVILSFPWFMKKRRLKDRRQFTPLTGNWKQEVVADGQAAENVEDASVDIAGAETTSVETTEEAES